MDKQRHCDLCDQSDSGSAAELNQAADKLARFHRVSWKEAFGKIVAPAFRLHRYRNAHDRLLQHALSELDCSDAGGCGAPIICALGRKSFYVAGMVVTNIERHLMPAQIVKIDGGAEETSYFLPTAKAIDATVIRNVITEMGLDLECVRPNQVRQWASKLARKLGW